MLRDNLINKGCYNGLVYQVTACKHRFLSIINQLMLYIHESQVIRAFLSFWHTNVANTFRLSNIQHFQEM